jgi:hypothetical protein
MSILLLFVIDVCMESNKINLKLLNLLWNTLPLTITESPSLNIFKNRLTHFYKTWDTNAHYNFGIRKFNIIHCQLKNEVSNLKAHLFNGGWNVLFSFLKLYPDCLGRYG